MGTFLEKRRYVGDDVPVTHESIEIDVIYSFHFRSLRGAGAKQHGYRNDGKTRCMPAR